MSEYSWDVRGIWFGVEGPKPDLPMLGIIKRSGRVRQLGHFCHVKISVNGKKVWASGAEDRTFYMHLVGWKDVGGYIPKDMIPALGWCKGGNTYAFLHEGKIVEAGRQGTLHEIPQDKWQDEWKERPITLVEKGAAIDQRRGMVNCYIALLPEPTEKKVWGVPRKPKPVVTLPLGHFDTDTKEFVKLTGALSLWNGPPPPWCKQVVQVYQTDSMGGWIHVKDKELTELWRRE
jgi:hypothetical protein